MVSRKNLLWVVAAPTVAIFAAIAYRKYGPKGFEVLKMGDTNFINYQLRRDQARSQIFGYKGKGSESEQVFICAPEWVREGVTKLKDLTSNVANIKIHGKPGTNILSPEPIEATGLDKFSDLVRLQILSRNEEFNTNGEINFRLYTPGIMDRKIIYSLKDLVRQTVIVGEAWTTAYGGFNAPQESQVARVYVCDLSALQFQREENTGRLVLLRKDPLPCGELDDFIYQNVVKEPKVTFKNALENKSRYIQCNSHNFGPVLFDTFAYKKFVAQDVILAGLALNELALKKSDHINFKFLKYGTGFFAEDFTDVINNNILDGVLDGLEQLFEEYKPESIKNVELPFYTAEQKHEERILDFERNYHVKIIFTKDDALKTNPNLPELITATTNCGDPHAVLGNEMRHQSVDAAIAENLKDKGYQFSPLMNSYGMKDIYFHFKSKY